VLLAGPTVLAFFTGGYFDEPRAWAGLVAWLLVAAAAVLGRNVLPRGRGAWLAFGGLAGMAAWTLASIGWAPLAGSAYHAGQIVVLYLGVLLAAAMLLRERRWQRAVEPVLAAGALIVIGYGLSARLLPGVLHFSRSVTAQGRLEQPLTYWNAMGELAALGFVLCARVAGDVTRPARLRVAAAVASAPLGMGLYLSVSRGALFACGAGVVALIVLAPRRDQLGALIVAVMAGGLAAAASAPFGGVTRLLGTPSTREGQGATVLALLAVIMCAAGIAQWLLSKRTADTPLRLPRTAPWLAAVVICAGLAGAIVVGAKERSGVPLGASASRLTSVQSNRYAYWRVAWKAFEHDPLRGVGAGGWAVWWLRYRPFAESAQDAHSLPLQTLAELGVIGLALLLVFLGGVGLAAARAMRASPALAAGPAAALVVYIVHAPLDWDWQMPAVTLVALVLAGLTIALAEREVGASRVDRQWSDREETCLPVA
jgi:O-Antigen ligase